jgi:VanZ family protein
MIDTVPSRRRIRWWIWSLVIGLWTVLLLLPIADPGPLRDLPAERREVLAKIVHVLAYAALTILSGWLRVPLRWRWLLIVVLMGHASLTELLQKLPQIGRGGSLADVGWDHLGVLLGLVITWKWWIRE